MKKILIIFLSFLLSNCYIERGTYYKLATHKNAKPYNLGVTKVQLNKNSHALLYLRAIHNSLRFSFVVPLKSNFQFASQNFIIKDRSSNKQILVPIKKICHMHKIKNKKEGKYEPPYHYTEKCFNFNKKIAGDVLEYRTLTFNKKKFEPIRFSIDEKINKKLPNKFDLILPNILIDGNSVKIPPMHFKKGIGHKFIGLET